MAAKAKPIESVAKPVYDWCLGFQSDVTDANVVQCMAEVASGTRKPVITDLPKAAVDAFTRACGKNVNPCKGKLTPAVLEKLSDGGSPPDPVDPAACKTGEEKVGSKCLPKCATDEVRKDEACEKKPIACDSGKEPVGGKCLPKCKDSEKREGEACVPKGEEEPSASNLRSFVELDFHPVGLQLGAIGIADEAKFQGTTDGAVSMNYVLSYGGLLSVGAREFPLRAIVAYERSISRLDLGNRAGGASMGDIGAAYRIARDRFSVDLGAAYTWRTVDDTWGMGGRGEITLNGASVLVRGAVTLFSWGKSKDYKLRLSALLVGSIYADGQAQAYGTCTDPLRDPDGDGKCDKPLDNPAQVGGLAIKPWGGDFRAVLGLGVAY